jgi:hypothetical protein
MTAFVSYLLATGEITQIGDDPGAIPGQGTIEVSRASLPFVSWVTHRVVDGVLVEYAAAPKAARVEADLWRRVRADRTARLAASDWTDTASAPARLGAEEYAAWQAYRQALRDITLQPDPAALDWPTPPA